MAASLILKIRMNGYCSVSREADQVQYIGLKFPFPCYWNTGNLMAYKVMIVNFL